MGTEVVDAIKIFGPVGGLLFLALVTQARGWWWTRGAHDAVVNGLSNQITRLDERVKRLEARLDEEREAAQARETRLNAILDSSLDQWGHVLDVTGVPRPSPTARRRGAPAA